MDKYCGQFSFYFSLVISMDQNFTTGTLARIRRITFRIFSRSGLDRFRSSFELLAATFYPVFNLRKQELC